MKAFTIILILVSALTSCVTNKLNYHVNSIPVKRTGRTVVVAANSQYDKISKSSRLWKGEHFRKEWATPVELEVLNLDSLPEKLTPTKMGGGNQTKSLRLKADDGKEYVLRSINKDPSKALPQEFVGTFADDIVQDQISSSHPYAPLVVAELASTTGIFHTTPKIVFVDSAKALGEFNSIFANSVCLLEERPSGNQEHNPEFGCSTNIINSEKLFEKLTEDKDHSVDEMSFLKARLFDMWIGDWDRHEDQWVWASFKENGKTIYKPIPRDRDQAFVSYDGLLPQIAARKWAVRRTQNFDYTIRDINGLNMSGNALDRMFTTQLTRRQWEEISHSLRQNLSDEKIEAAFAKLPIEIRDISSQSIIKKLERRRDDLLQYARTYYQFLSEEVNILGSDKREKFVVNRVNDAVTSVMVCTLNKHNEVTDTTYYREFFTDETREIRLYGFDGEDTFVFQGTKNRILVRVMGGAGNDTVESNKKLSTATIVYDGDVKMKVAGDVIPVRASTDSVKTTFNRRSFKYDWLAPKITPGFNPDDGVYIGGGITFKKQGFGKTPFKSTQSVWGNYAMQTGAYNFQYDALFKEKFGKWDLKIMTRLNAPNAIYNYYGMGNETTVQHNNWNYYRVRLNQLISNPGIQRQLGKSTISLGLKFSAIKLERTEDRFISSTEAQLDSSAFQRKFFNTIQMGYAFNSLDNNMYPTKGFKHEVGIEHTQNIKDGGQFTRLTSETSYFKSIGSVTFALRAGGSTIRGEGFEFYQSNTLGGLDNLRGYRRTRFSGQSNIFQNTELRLKFNKLDGYVWRGHYGMLTFFDAGRVWAKNEHSNQWHYGYGIGVWYLPYDKVSFTATYGFSRESDIVNIRAGFLF